MLIILGLGLMFTSCIYKEGCSEPDAINYDDAVKSKNDDGSCQFKWDIDKATGTYFYEQINLSNDEVEKGNFIVKQNGDKIEFWKEEEKFLEGSKIITKNNGFIFDIESQTITYSDETFEIVGFDPKSSDGLFDYDKKEIVFGIKGESDNSQEINFIYELNKQ